MGSNLREKYSVDGQSTTQHDATDDDATRDASTDDASKHDHFEWCRRFHPVSSDADAFLSPNDPDGRHANDPAADAPVATCKTGWSHPNPPEPGNHWKYKYRNQ